MVEIWDLYDKNKNKLKDDQIRGEKIPDGAYHLVVHVWIKNKNNEYLISQRSTTKRTYPLFWECVGGSIVKGETTFEGAIREAFEEVGVDLNNCENNFVTSFVRDEYQDIVDVYEFYYDGKITMELATTDEAVDAKWMKKDEIIKYFNEGKLLPTLEYYLKYLK